MHTSVKGRASARRRTHLFACLIGSATLGVTLAVALALAASSTAAGPAKPWLVEINRYRTAAGLPPIADEPAWSAGILAHLRYLERTSPRFRVGRFRNAHLENPRSPFFTKAGAAAGRSSNLGFGASDTAAIDGWLGAPFHAIGILRPGLRKVGFARDPKTGRAGLDVLRGLLPRQIPIGHAVLFPGNGMKTDLAVAEPELPDPLETCGWKHAGLPFIALLAAPPARSVDAALTGPAGRRLRLGAGLCVVTRGTFHTTDVVYGPTAVTILADDRAVVVIPHPSLVPGPYRVRILQPGRPPIAWSFAVTPPRKALTRDLVSFSGLGPHRPVSNSLLEWPTIQIRPPQTKGLYDWRRSSVRIVPRGTNLSCPDRVRYRACRGRLAARLLPLPRATTRGGVRYAFLGARYSLRDVVSAFRCTLSPVCDILRPGTYRIEVTLRGAPLGEGPPVERTYSRPLVVR